MANSTASVYIKPTVTFNRGDTFVFGAWVCTADGGGSVQRRLTMPPKSETGLMTLPEVVTSELAGKFGKISLLNQHADFELGSSSNSNSTSPWAIVCESATETSHVDSPPREPLTRPPQRQQGPHEGSHYAPGRQGTCTRVRLGLRHRPRLQLGLQPSLRLLLGLRIRIRLRGRTLMSPSPRTTPQSNPCQDQLPAWL
jgi:hypothetical protein